MTKLRIASNLSLPADAVTQTIVVYGGKGMGKTNLGSVLCEELSRAHLRFAVLDPMGVWWGLRHSKDGKGEGIEVLILGGKHGDLEIEPTAGAVVADLIADEDADVIVDISRRRDGTMWSLGERIRFVTDYCTRLYTRQGERARPLMQLIDEAGRFVPQMIPHGSPQLAACVGAIERMVEEGRNVGIGVTLITQRSARMNKSVSELAECMIAFRTVGPRSIDAILDWFGEHVEKARWKELLEQLRALPRGTALVVSPGWLGYEGIADIRERETFDSSATPTAGKERRASGPGKKPDLGKYQQRMAEVTERAKAEDPKVLKKQIAELEKALKHAGAKRETVEKVVQVVDDAAVGRAVKRVVKEAMRQVREKQRGLLRTVNDAAKTLDRARQLLEKATTEIGGAAAALAAVPTEEELLAVELQEPAARQLDGRPLSRLADPPPPARVARVAPVERVRAARPVVEGNGALSPSEQKILNALALLQELGIEQPDRGTLAFFSGYAVAGRYNNLVGALKSAGYLAYPVDGTVTLTDMGTEHAEAGAHPIRTLEDLHGLWQQKLPPSEWKVLDALLSIYPDALSREELASKTGYTVAGRFNNVVGRLRSLGAATYPREGHVAASELLFPAGLR